MSASPSGILALGDAHLQPASPPHGDLALAYTCVAPRNLDLRRSQRQSLKDCWTLEAISSTHLRGEETKAQKSKINKSRVHSQRRRQSQDQNPALLLLPSLELLHRCKRWLYFRVYLPRTMMDQFKCDPACPSGWETINFLHISLGTDVKNNFFFLCMLCVL